MVHDVPGRQPSPAYPQGRVLRDQFVVSVRPDRTAHDPWRSHAVVIEDERTESGAVERVATVFLTGRECPWRCVMCDLWQFTIDADTPPGAIAAQVDAAVLEVGRVSQPGRQERQPAAPSVTRMKLYNAGSFFDPRAVPPGDYDAVAAATRGMDRVIVESHPSLVGPRTARFLETLERARSGPVDGTRLEVAMGLETAHPSALDRLNKGMSVDDFRRAAATLAEMHVALRVFLLISPPFVAAREQDDWLARSVDVAFACGATVVSLIPTRSGNGAMEVLATAGQFMAPRLDDVERSLALALQRPRPPGGRVFVDLWDLARVSACAHCFEERRQRLALMNFEQRDSSAITCGHCGGD